MFTFKYSMTYIINYSNNLLKFNTFFFQCAMALMKQCYILKTVNCNKSYSRKAT